ncbi:MAG: nicotinate (nicotinamide) nucleotide adenylyltransferase [Flavobacteriales bacterium]|jgi:nicotinate-nucleotide adenylyltransferase
MKVGLYFGSFNPPHRGHFAIAQAAIAHHHLDEVWFVVSPQNPFKTNHVLAPENVRLEMVQLICRNNAQLKACDVEFPLPKPNYTCDTLRLLSTQFAHAFHLIIGEDNWRVFDQWREHEWILQHYPVLVYGRRPGEAESSTPNKHAGVHFIPGEYIDVSATEIRSLIQRGASIAELVDDAVADYIEQHNLYR